MANRYSFLKATIGSTLVARCAGTYDASIVTSPNMTATATNVVASSGATQALRMSESVAYKRITAARAVQRFP